MNFLLALILPISLGINFALADMTPTAPGPGDTFNAGGDCTIQWTADQSGYWKNVTIDLMSGSNLNMSLVTNVVTGLDGTDPTLIPFIWTCPEVDPYSDIYIYQFTNNGQTGDAKWTARFTIASPSGQSEPPMSQSQPDGSPGPWGTGHLVDTEDDDERAQSMEFASVSSLGSSNLGSVGYPEQVNVQDFHSKAVTSIPAGQGAAGPGVEGQESPSGEYATQGAVVTGAVGQSDPDINAQSNGDPPGQPSVTNSGTNSGTSGQASSTAAGGSDGNAGGNDDTSADGQDGGSAGGSEDKEDRRKDKSEREAERHGRTAASESGTAGSPSPSKTSDSSETSPDATGAVAAQDKNDDDKKKAAKDGDDTDDTSTTTKDSTSSTKAPSKTKKSSSTSDGAKAEVTSKSSDATPTTKSSHKKAGTSTSKAALGPTAAAASHPDPAATCSCPATPNSAGLKVTNGSRERENVSPWVQFYLVLIVIYILY